jgi:hypothetical protein
MRSPTNSIGKPHQIKSTRAAPLKAFSAAAISISGQCLPKHNVRLIMSVYSKTVSHLYTPENVANPSADGFTKFILVLADRLGADPSAGANFVEALCVDLETTMPDFRLITEAIRDRLNDLNQKVRMGIVS